jgi:hypothetical protein
MSALPWLPLLRYLATIGAAAAFGGLVGAGADALSGARGWWFIGLLGGAVGGSALAAALYHAPGEPPPADRRRLQGRERSS